MVISLIDLLIADPRFMDSTGLNVLVKAHQQAQDCGRRLAPVRGCAQVQRLLSVTGLDGRLLIVDAPEELLGLG